MSSTQSNSQVNDTSEGPENGLIESTDSVTTDENRATFSPVSDKRDVGHLVDLAEDLRAITTTSETYPELIQGFLQAAITRGNLLGITWIEFANDNPPKTIASLFKNEAMNNQATRDMILASSAACYQTRTQEVFDSNKLKGSLAAAFPVYKDESTTAVVCGLFHDDKSRCSEAVSVCQSVANHFELWRSREQVTNMAAEVRCTAAALELVGKCENSRTVKEACVKAANELQNHFRCDYVAIGLRNRERDGCRLMAVSSLGEYDNQSRTSMLFQGAFDETILLENQTSFPDFSRTQSGTALLHKKLVGHLRSEAAISTPLRNADDEIVGAITILGNRSLAANESTMNLIRAMEHPLGSTLEIVKIAQGGWVRRLQRLFFKNEKSQMKWVFLGLFLISCIAMFVQIPYRVPAECTAEPVVRSYGVAPHDGLLESTNVEPGDVVEKGQILAKMDGREIGFKIADTLARKNRAAREYDSYLASKETSKAIQAELEHLGLAAELRVLEHLQSNLEVRSTLDGIVLSGSIDKRENFPVTLGQTLYEIAPISPLRVELAIPADEIMHVRTGQKVSFRFDGFGTETQIGKIELIRPSSTIRDDENVFIAEALLPNKDGMVRPGMKGDARIYGTERSIGWSLFHHPWEKLIYAFGL